MRSPALWLAGHLLGTRSGTVWATWQLRPLPYGHRGTTAKDAARTWHRALMRAIPGEWLLLSVAASMDPVAVVARMIDGIPLEEHPEWAAECEATYDTLNELALGQRAFFLSVPLRDAKLTAAITEKTRSARTTVEDWLAVPRRPVPPAVLARWQAQARDLEQDIPKAFEPRPATVAQMVWLFCHAQERGLYRDPDLPAATDPTSAEELELTLQSGSALQDPLIDEGGRADPVDRITERNPFTRRYVKVVPPHAPDTPSYQALLALAALPSAGMVFPGSEFLGNIDDAGLDVDWAVRCTIRSRDEVSARNRRALRALNDQYDQRDGELSTGPHELDQAARDLTEYQATLAADENEVEVQATVIFAVGDRTPHGVRDKARALTAHFAARHYTLAYPLGAQQALWWAMQPGTPAGRPVREFAQITTSHNFAAAVPLASTELGDSRGPLLALNISTGLPGVVHHDVAGAAAKLDASGSVAACGELGAGKSLTLKKITQDAVDRGGRFIAVDRTESGEWVTMAASLPSATVVDVLNPVVSMDPLRMFDPTAGARICQSFLTPLLNVKPTSPGGVLLSEVLDPDYLAAHGITGLGELNAHLAGEHTTPQATELHRMINVYARKDFGRVVFDPHLPTLNLADRAIVCHTHGLELPSRDDIANPHLFDQMSLEKVFGRALYALCVALARQICFSNRSELAVFAVDETHHITASTEGERELIVFVRDGRKHQAAALIGTHDPEEDLPSPVLRGLVPTRLLMRHRDPELARRALRWLGLDPKDDDLIRMITEDTSPVVGDEVPEPRRGEALMRDARGRIGRVKVLLPARAQRAEAVKTTPPETLVGGT